MTNKNLYAYSHGGITSFALEGHANGLEESLSKYRKEGRFRMEADFSPILRRLDNRLFLAGNIYGSYTIIQITNC